MLLGWLTVDKNTHPFQKIKILMRKEKANYCVKIRVVHGFPSHTALVWPSMELYYGLQCK